MHKRRAAVKGHGRFHNTGSWLFNQLCLSEQAGSASGWRQREKMGKSPCHQLKQSPNVVGVNFLEFGEIVPFMTESWSNCLLYQEGDFRGSDNVKMWDMQENVVLHRKFIFESSQCCHFQVLLILSYKSNNRDRVSNCLLKDGIVPYLSTVP